MSRNLLLKRGAVAVGVSLALAGCLKIGGGLVVDGWSYAKWDSRWESVQVESVNPVDVHVSLTGQTISTATVNKTSGISRAVVVKHDVKGKTVGTAELPETGSYVLRDSEMDAKGNIVLAVSDKDEAGIHWRIIKLSATPDANGKLPVLWSTQWGWQTPYTLALGSTGDVWVMGRNWDNQMHVLRLDGETGRVGCSYDSGDYANGSRGQWAATVVARSGVDRFYGVYPRDIVPMGLDIVQMDQNCSGIDHGDLRLDNSVTQVLHDPATGKMLVGGTAAGNSVVKRIDGVDADAIETIAYFPGQRFGRMLLDTTPATGGLYVANEQGKVPDTDVVLSKLSATCNPEDAYLCWDETYNQATSFGVDVSLLGSSLINDFSYERPVELYLQRDEIVMVTSSRSQQAAGMLTQNVTQLLGYSQADGQGRRRFQVSSRDAVAASRSPLDPSLVSFVAMRSDATDPEPVLYTSAAQMMPVEKK